MNEQNRQKQHKKYNLLEINLLYLLAFCFYVPFPGLKNNTSRQSSMKLLAGGTCIVDYANNA